MINPFIDRKTMSERGRCLPGPLGMECSIQVCSPMPDLGCLYKSPLGGETQATKSNKSGNVSDLLQEEFVSHITAQCRLPGVGRG